MTSEASTGRRRAAVPSSPWPPPLALPALVLVGALAAACKLNSSALGGASPAIPPAGPDATGDLGGSSSAPGAAEQPPADGPPPAHDAPRPAGPDAAGDLPRPADPPDMAPPPADGAVVPPAPGALPPPPDAAPGGAGCPPARGGPRLVKVNGFCIDATEVTNADYLVFWNARRSDASGQIPACAWNASFTPEATATAPWPPESGRERRPVVNVDWCDAHAFCQWAGKRLCGRVGGGSLPRWQDAIAAAISQWTYACSSGGRNVFPYGDSYDPDACNAQRSVSSATSLVDVGSKPGCRTDGGVHDLNGNVEEWADACIGTGDPASDACALVGGTAVHRTASDFSCLESAYPGRRSSRFELRGFRCCSP